MENIVISAGGVVFLEEKMLLLEKFNGDWVLPKGHIEVGEHRMVTALREVAEEADVKARLHQYIGQIEYQYYDVFYSNQYIHKTVHWYLMTALNDHCSPQREEGFKKASYIPIAEILPMMRYEDEIKIVKEAIDIYRQKYLDRI